jgi:hypothetical protein
LGGEVKQNGDNFDNAVLKKSWAVIVRFLNNKSGSVLLSSAVLWLCAKEHCLV